MFPKDYVKMNNLTKELVFLKQFMWRVAALDIESSEQEVGFKKIFEPLQASQIINISNFKTYDWWFTFLLNLKGYVTKSNKEIYFTG